MKKFFTLLMASAATLCANASGLTFEVGATSSMIVVNPSNEIDNYFCAVLDEYTMSYWAMFGVSAETPDMLFMYASSVYDTNIYSGRHTENVEDGKYVVVIAEADYDADQSIVAQGDINVVNVTVGANSGEQGGDNGDKPGYVDIDFTIESNGPSFTLIPSVDNQDFYYWVFSTDEMDMLAEVGYTDEFVISAYAATASDKELHQGTVIDNADNWYLGDEFGTYYVLAAAVAYDAEQDIYVLVSPVSKLVWEYTDEIDIPVALQNLAASKRATKAFANGALVLDGKYSINGTIIK